MTDLDTPTRTGRPAGPDVTTAVRALREHADVSAHCAPHLHLAVAAATPNLRHVEWFRVA